MIGGQEGARLGIDEDEMGSEMMTGRDDIDIAGSRQGGERERFYTANKEPVVPLQDVLKTGAGVMLIALGA